MVQIINRPPSPSEVLGESLGQGFQQGLGSALSNMFEQKQRRSALQGLSPYFQEAGFQPEQINEIIQSGIDPALAVAGLKVHAMNQARQAKMEPQGINPATQDSFNRMAELLKSGRVGWAIPFSGSGPLSEKAAEAKGEFNSLTAALEAELVDRVSRGTLSDARFKYITQTLLPKASDREAKIRGKLKGLARELGLDPSAIMEQEEVKVFGNKKLQLKDPKTGKTYYPTSQEDVKKAKAAGWEVLNEK